MVLVTGSYILSGCWCSYFGVWRHSCKNIAIVRRVEEWLFAACSSLRPVEISIYHCWKHERQGRFNYHHAVKRRELRSSTRRKHQTLSSQCQNWRKCQWNLLTISTNGSGTCGWRKPTIRSRNIRHQRRNQKSRQKRVLLSFVSLLFN